MSRNSGGRSAVSTISGTPASSASTTAGWRLAAAEPDVQSTAAGLPVARAVPRAKNPALRSSRITVTSMPGSCQRATARGVEREPGETTARSTPERASSSAIAEARAVLRFVLSTAANRRSVEPPRRKRVFVDLDAQAGAVADDQLVALDGQPAPDGRREQPSGGKAVRDSGIAAPVPQRLRRMRGGRDAHRSLQCTRKVRRHHLGDLQRGTEPADFGDLHRRDLASLQLTSPAGVKGGDQAFIRRDAHVDTATQ